ncbi:MAG: DNA polymerase domain-containing protein [Thermoplasmatota archaeon]
MKGWILDVYPDLKKGKMILWVRGKKRCYKIAEDYDTVFYAKSSNNSLENLKDFYEERGFSTDIIRRKTGLQDDGLDDLLKISPGMVYDPTKQAEGLNFFNGYDEYQFYNIDVPLEQRFMVDKDMRPFSLVEKKNGKWIELESDAGIRYSKPDLRKTSIRASIDTDSYPTFKDELISIETDKGMIEGSEKEILKILNKEIEHYDPDIIVTKGGDSFLIPYLSRRAKLNEIELVFGREPSLHPPKQGSSYVSYGRVLYKPPKYLFKGRIHIDMDSSFMFRKGGLDGLIEISRMSGMPLQRISRRSPGAVINAMETEQALKDGYLVPWKSNITEDFKTMKQLINSDRGGYIFEPKVGVHEDVIKLDFASMYPTIIDKYNLSPETLNCDCDNYHVVPELGYKVCEEKRGLIPKVISPIIRRRQAYKEMADKDDIYRKRADVLKWLLVTSFGYTGYKKARFSCIEVHESVTAYGREILLKAADIAQDMSFRVMHGIVDSLWLKGDKSKVDTLIEKVREETKVTLEKEGIYDWVVFLPNKSDGVGALNRYYGTLDGELEVRGIHLRRSDTPDFFSEVQENILGIMEEAESIKEIEDRFDEIIETSKTAWLEIKRGEIDIEKLYFTKQVSKRAEDYKHMTDTKAALMQLGDMDVELSPGESLRYVVTNSKSKDYREKVKVEGADIKNYDRKYYENYLFRVIGEILVPFNYDERKISEILKKI